jgi:hypothetical protein
MEKMSYYSFVAAVIAVGLAFLLYLAHILSGLRAARMQTAGMPSGTGTLGLVIGPRTATLGRYGSILGWLGFVPDGRVVFHARHRRPVRQHTSSRCLASGISRTDWFERSYQRILGLGVLPWRG